MFEPLCSDHFLIHDEGPPEIIRDEAELDAVLTQPSPTLRDFISQVNSPLVILGAGGKMGPTLAVLAKQRH